jgi:hypothetical protein
MKTTNIHHKIWIIYCILICIPFYCWNAPQKALAAEPNNSLTVDKFIHEALGSIELPQVQGPLYLECSLPKNHFYLGERVPATVTLYVGNLVVNNVDWPTLSQPEFMLDKNGNYSEQKLRINGRSYQVIKFPCLLSPLQTGSLQLGPINETLYLPTTTGRQRTTNVTTDPIRVRVSDLPSQGRPENFSGGVGNFYLNVSATPHQVKLGEPITIRMAISGSGNLQVVSAPLLNKNTTGLKVYPALKKADSQTAGRVIFEQIVIPVDTHAKQVGPFSFTYFNPNNGKYSHIVSPALSISVKANANFKNDEQNPSTPDLAHSNIASIKPNLDAIYPSGQLWVQMPCFWIWHLIAVFLLLGAIFYRKYTQFLQSDSPRARALRSSNLAKEQMAAVQNLSEEGRYDDFLDQLHQILREFLAERYELAAAGMTGSVVGILSQKGVPPEILQEIQSFFEQYDSHRFAHLQFQQDEAIQLLEKVKQIIAFFDKF